MPDSVERIRVTGFKISGNTLIPSERLQALIRPYEGQDLTLEEIKAAASAITTLYEQEGYFLVRALVPPQEFQGGVVELLVLEGKLGEVTVEGNEHYSTEFITGHFNEAIGEDRNFRAEGFQRALLLLNEYPDLRVTSVLRPGKEAGTADVLLNVQDAAPFHGTIDYNNFGSPLTGQNRVGLQFDAGNLMGRGDQLTVRGVLGFPGSQNSFYQASYVVPIDYDGTRLGASYASGAFTVGRELQILDLRGLANIYTLSASKALVRTLDTTVDLFMALSYNDVNNSVLGQPFNRDRYTAVRVGSSADFRDLEGRTFVRGTVSQGLGGLDDFTTVSRLGARGNFTKFNLDVARIQTLGKGFYGVLRGSGQYSSAPLIAAEQYALGGPDSVRGYAQAELLGDSAYNLSLELRWSPITDQTDLFQVVTFFDMGTVRRRFLQPGEILRQSLTGTGFGFRASPWTNTQLRLDIGFPLSPTTNALNSNPAVYGQVQTRF